MKQPLPGAFRSKVQKTFHSTSRHTRKQRFQRAPRGFSTETTLRFRRERCGPAPFRGETRQKTINHHRSKRPLQVHLSVQNRRIALSSPEPSGSRFRYWGGIPELSSGPRQAFRKAKYHGAAHLGLRASSGNPLGSSSIATHHCFRYTAIDYMFMKTFAFTAKQ